MARIGLLAVLVTALLAVSAASAKGPSQALVCGRSVELPTERTCVAMTEQSDLLYQLIDMSEPFSLGRRPRPAPFYTVVFRFPDGSRWNWSYLYVPSRGMIRVTTAGRLSVYWRSAPASVVKAFEQLRTRVRPFPAPRRWR